VKFFQNKLLSIATMHSKEKVIGPLLSKNLGLTVTSPDFLNTDIFGTFTREKKRKGTPLETAIIKASSVFKDKDVDLGVSSEGSFTTHPAMPQVSLSEELVVLIDKERSMLIYGSYASSNVGLQGEYVYDIAGALELAKKYNFPSHGVILRKSKNSKYGLFKDIKTEDELIEICRNKFKSPFTRKLFLETDMRAHRNPTRMINIEKATNSLVEKAKIFCPKCNIPGFGTYSYTLGLECKICNKPTKVEKYRINGCKSCNHSTEIEIEPGNKADPLYCEFCNP
jgi:hypothetical protein